MDETTFDWSDLRIFLAVARTGGLAAAAKASGQSSATLGRHIVDLERALGEELFRRLPSGYALTEAGKKRLAQIEAVEDRILDMVRNASDRDAGLPIRISAGTWMTWFLTRHIDALGAARNILVFSAAEDSTFGARKLALVERLVVAAPAYLSSRGEPATPAELAGHDCIIQHGVFFGRESWRFAHDHTVTSVDLSAKLWINSAPGVLAAAVAGLGVALATRVMAGEELRSGQLVQLLGRYRLEPAEVYAVFPAGPKPSAKVRAIVDHLGAALETSGQAFSPAPPRQA